MRRAGAVALNTFREAVRDRVLYNLVFFALLMMAAAILVGGISIGIEEMVIKSLGLSAISVIGLLIAVFIGVGLVYKEMDKRTLYALLAKPVRRWEFLLGKFGGLVLTLAVNTLAMAAGLVVALALLFSCYTTPLLAILYTSALYIAGLFVEEMRTFHFAIPNPAMESLLRGLSYLLPNFENFNVMAAAAHGRDIPGTLILQNTAYAALYSGIVLLVAAAVFSHRN